MTLNKFMIILFSKNFKPGTDGNVFIFTGFGFDLFHYKILKSIRLDSTTRVGIEPLIQTCILNLPYNHCDTNCALHALQYLHASSRSLPGSPVLVYRISDEKAQTEKDKNRLET